MNIINCKDLFKTYPLGFSGQSSVYALKDLDLQVESGEVFGLVGPNGAGKSTLLKILMGFIRPDSGTAYLANQPAGSPASRNIVGYMPENPCLYKHLSIKDHLQFASQIAQLPAKETKKRIAHILEVVELAEVAENPLYSYSKGMAQRAAMAYALFLEPGILILDEPMSGLDPVGRHKMVEIILQYQKAGTTILFSSHILADVEYICTRISIMDKGEIRATTTPGELLNKKVDTTIGATRLESFFLQTLSQV